MSSVRSKHDRSASDQGSSRPSGLVLITGTTGPGIATTRAACLRAIKERPIKLIRLVGAPSEYVMERA